MLYRQGILLKANYKTIADSCFHPQLVQANALYVQAGVPKRACGVPEIQKFQNQIQAADFLFLKLWAMGEKLISLIGLWDELLIGRPRLC